MNEHAGHHSNGYKPERETHNGCYYLYEEYFFKANFTEIEYIGVCLGCVEGEMQR